MNKKNQKDQNFKSVEKSVGALSFRRFTVKKIPEKRGIITEPYEHIDEDVML